ncbi:hypothetical protein B0H19DRAFT_1338926 [Mycena capillaripes]|nr:hypothetical protein B0H19DRAFT_1338926 [Mycena capillaripes]
MFFISFGLLILATVSVASPTPSAIKLWTGAEALAAGLLKVIPAPPEGFASLSPPVNTALGTPTPDAFSNHITLWNTTLPLGATLGYDPGTFGQGFFFCVDLTLRDTFFNDMAQSFFAATDLSCNLFINAGCTGTAITDVPRGDFITLTGILHFSQRLNVKFPAPNPSPHSLHYIALYSGL